MWNVRFISASIRLSIPVAVLLAISLQCHAQQTSLQACRDELDGEILSQGTSKDGFLNPESQTQILTVLKAIREKFPEVAMIHARPSFSLDTLMVVLTTNGQEIIERKVNMASDSPREVEISGGTGISGLDQLNSKYGAASVSAFFSTRVLLIKFKAPMDIAVLTNIHSAIPEVPGTKIDKAMGGGDNIQLKREGDAWQFTFIHGWGDCPSGCIHKHYYYFSYRPDTQTVTKTGEKGDVEAPPRKLSDL